MMEIREIYDKKIWEDFLAQCAKKTFLQSWYWGQFHKSMGNRIWRFGIYENNELVSVILTVKISAKRSSFLLVPHGPVIENPKSQTQNPKSRQSRGSSIESGQIQNTKSQILKVLLTKLKELVKDEKVDFIRVSPIWERTEENNNLFRELGFRIGPLHYHPESSWKLNIESPEEEIFNRMRKTTRYLIKQGQNSKDIEIVKSTDVKDLETFYKIHNEVVRVQKFVPFSLDYLTKEFNAFLEDNNISLFLAKYSPPHQTEKDCAKLGHKIKPDSPLWCGGKGEIIAGSFEIFWSGIGFYHHAGLLPKYKKLPVSYLLQWEAIKEAKKRGCKIYDFWGYADPEKNLKHPYAGPTLFKMGFGGYKDEYVKTQDFVISKKYWVNYVIEKVRKMRRGL